MKVLYGWKGSVLVFCVLCFVCGKGVCCVLFVVCVSYNGNWGVDARVS